MINYKTLNHDEVFSLLALNPFGFRVPMGSEKRKNLVAQIMATVLTHKNGDAKGLIEALGDLVETHSNMSIGMALDALHSISTLGKELDGDHDGLDALCYHLSGNSCEKGIAALQAVLRRFKEMEKEDEAKRAEAKTVK